MGYYVHLSVIMPCDKNEPVAEIAKKHIEKVADCKEAQWYLQDLSTKSGNNPGPKGGLSMWGMITNYGSGSHFAETLIPFWAELFQTKAGPLDFEHIIVFSEPEQSEQATAYEISYSEKTNQVTIEEHGLPFAWMQF